MALDRFVILDFGSQFSQLITRRLRELGFFSELVPYDTSVERLRELRPRGIILSGGPASVNDPGAPVREIEPLREIAPVLGICYGMQLIAHKLGGQVRSSEHREYGFSQVSWQKAFVGVPAQQNVWSSFGDIVQVPPAGLSVVATTGVGHPAALMGDRLWALQFHPEVAHTEAGLELLRAYAQDLCGAEPNWQSPTIAKHLIDQIKSLVPAGEKVLCALSGGVDSTVVAVLLTQALGPQTVQCVFVDNGLLRQGEFDEVLHCYKQMGLNVEGVDARQRFLASLAGLSEPEAKRKAIGRTFIEVFKMAVQGKGELKWLAQGTLYPDVIESVSPRGTSVTIKSHHNVGGLPKDLDLKLVEPLRELFKDEVRALGRELGVPREILMRHPFPGPGLAIRVLGPVNEQDLEIVRQCDHIFIEELKKAQLYDQIWQAFCVLLPVRTVGVQGDGRTYEKVLGLRAVTSFDGMTADWFDFKTSFLRDLSNQITNRVKGVNRVVYDITSKPPGTIEWE